MRQQIVKKAKRQVLEKHNLDDEKRAYLDLLEQLKSLRPDPKAFRPESEGDDKEEVAVEEALTEASSLSDLETTTVDKPKCVKQKVRVALNGHRRVDGGGTEVDGKKNEQKDGKKNDPKLQKTKKVGQKAVGDGLQSLDNVESSKSGKKTAKKTDNGVKKDGIKKSASPCAENRTSLEASEASKKRLSPILNGTSHRKGKTSKGQSSPRAQTKVLKDVKKAKKP